MSLTSSSVSEEAFLILMLHAVVLCSTFPSGAMIALPPGGWHRFVVPVAALSTPPSLRSAAAGATRIHTNIAVYRNGFKKPSPDRHHDLDSTTVYPDPRQGRDGLPCACIIPRTLKCQGASHRTVSNTNDYIVFLATAFLVLPVPRSY